MMMIQNLKKKKLLLNTSDSGNESEICWEEYYLKKDVWKCNVDFCIYNSEHFFLRVFKHVSSIILKKNILVWTFIEIYSDLICI